MNPLSKEEVQAKIATELEITHLSQEEQEEIINTLAEAMLERATVIIMAKMPEGEFENVDALIEAGQTEEVQNKILQLVPDAPQIVDKVLKDGVAEYKQLVEQEKGGDAESATVPSVATQSGQGDELARPAPMGEPVGSPGMPATPAGATSATPAPAPADTTPVATTPAGATPVGATPVGATPVGATPAGAAPTPPVEENFVVNDSGEAQPTGSSLAGQDPLKVGQVMPDTSIPNPLTDFDKPDQPAY